MGRKARRNNSRRQNNQPNQSNVISFTKNQQAIQEDRKRKTWSIHDLKPVRPLTENQEKMFDVWNEGNNICASGCAGVGKSFLAMNLAFSEILDTREQHKIIIVRSAVSTREIGHLPGTKEEKEETFQLPYVDICTELFGRKSTYSDMRDAGLIEFFTTSHIRGLTWDNAIIFIDEVQNMHFTEIDSVLTRTGNNSRIIVCGDNIRQCDLKKHEISGMQQMINAFNKMDDVDIVNFDFNDIVRSGFAKSWIEASS